MLASLAAPLASSWKAKSGGAAFPQRRSMSSVWRQSFSDLRKHFENGSDKHPDLRCVMAQTTDLEGDSAQLLELARFVELGVRQTWDQDNWFPVSQGKYRFTRATGTKEVLEEVLEPSRYWCVQFCGDQEGQRLFIDIAKNAGDCLPDLAHPAIHALPKGFLEGAAIGPYRWLLLLFHLAWLNLPSTLLRASRQPEGRESKHVDPLGVFYSALPMNPFQASVAAIDILLARLNDECFEPLAQLLEECKWLKPRIKTEERRLEVTELMELLEGLWDRARLATGVSNVPPELPQVATQGEAVQAIALLACWAADAREGAPNRVENKDDGKNRDRDKAPRGNRKEPGKKRGPKLKYDPKDDERINDAWSTGRYNNYDDLARERGKDERRSDIEKAIDRHRHKPKSSE
jgi:hypothetical protein